MVNTRLNPTINGTLHLGHIFILLINEYFAHSRGGKFYVRFDDDNSLVDFNPKWETKYVAKSQLEDIKWMDVEVDGWSYQSTILPEVKIKLKQFGYEAMPEDKLGEYKLPLCIRMGNNFIPYPYVPNQTAERVVMDNMLGITHVIRGDDFISEFSLYSYFCQKFGFETPEFIFIPRLMGLCGEISKTNGGYKIADFRAGGYTAERIKRMMAETCLWYPNNGFELYNIKPNPRINM